jgi:putative ATP-dependent DNA ligase
MAGAKAITTELLDEALSRRKARRESYEGLGYLRFTDDFHGVPKGTVVIDDGPTVWGYPHIGRILRLDTGLAEQFDAPFWMEEKLDGYNVRVFLHQDRVLAITRGGYICPFSTDRIPELLDTGFFRDQPRRVLCAEIAGPDNPYMEGTPPYVTEDVQAFVFDVARLDRPGFLSQADKAVLLERYGLPAVPVLGRFTYGQVEEIRAILRDLNRRGIEGVVLKEDSPRNRRTKYVTSHSGIYDIAITSQNMLQLPAEYFTGRVLRLALFMEEEGIRHTRDLDRQLGAAFLDGLLAGVEQYKREGRIYRSYRCRFREKKNLDLFREHMRHAMGHTHFTVRTERREGGYWLFEFDKQLPQMTSLLKHVMSGGVVFD